MLVYQNSVNEYRLAKSEATIDAVYQLAEVYKWGNYLIITDIFLKKEPIDI